MSTTKPTFSQVSSKVDYPAQERDLLAWWGRHGIVDKYLARNDAG